MSDPADPLAGAAGASARRTLGTVLAEQSGHGLPTEDVLHAVLPLMRAVAGLHERGRVADIGLGTVMEGADGRLALLHPEGIEPIGNLAELRRIQPAPSSALKVVGEYRVTTDEAGTSVLDLDAAGAADAAIDKPVFVPGLRTWELEVGHHDEIVDIFQAGMVLAALAIGFDPSQRDHIARFSSNRANLFALQPRLHPVLAGAIVEMTALNRHDRATDLAALVTRLERYRDQPAGLEVERVLSASSGTGGRRRAVLAHLRDRLFDLSRRNRLLYFKPSQASVNLTEASVPIVVRLEAIRQEDLCTWNGGFAEALLSGKPVPLGRWLRFEDQPQLPTAFDRLIQTARRDRAEFGFSTLRLVVAFLRWHNLKDAPEERIVSPLLWLPVEVTRTKGVRDQYVVRVTDAVAEVNPALSHRLRQLYGIALPERVDLAVTDVAALHADLLRQIQASEPGVQLALQTRPQIRLIHQRAVQRVQQFNRRRGAPRAAVSTSVDFSYAKEDYRPLGHVLFEKFVRPSPLPQRLAAGGHLRPGPSYAVAPQEGLGIAYGVDEGHRFAWEVDLTQVTLANFNHRKMSLVRDYADLIDGDLPQPVFDGVFSIEPRPLDTAPPPPVPLADTWSVVAADETQDAAVALARTGKSFIIQGPPGTGKSQTIANLIADGVARGRRILFVCEKRAALDVVYHRLGLAGLDGLACIIHDSQDDKKAFIADLKNRYESWIKTPDDRAAAERARSATVAVLEQVERELDALEAAAGFAAAGPGTSLRALIRRAAALAPPPDGFGPAAREALPALGAWDAARPVAERANRTARELLGVSGIAASAFARLSGALVGGERPVAALERAIAAAEAELQALDRWLDGGSGYASGATRVGSAAAVCRAAEAALGSGLAANLPLLDPASPDSAELARAQRSIARLESKRAAAAEDAKAWTRPMSPADAAAGLEQARAREGSFFRFLSGAWRQVKSAVEARYDFAAHAVRPTVTAALEGLVALHQAEAALAREQAAAAERFGSPDLQALVRARDALAARRDEEPDLHGLLTAAGAAADPAGLLAPEAKAAEPLARLLAALDGVVEDPASLSFDALAELLRDLREGLDELPQFLPALRDVHGLDPSVARLLLDTPLPLAALEALVLDEAIVRTERLHPGVRAFDIDRLIALTRTATQARARLREQNAAAIRARSHAAFRENVRRSTLALSQLDAAGRAFKAAYATGRRELEHEFGKTMRYRSIRDLADDETGMVVRDLKPVWLMSPLSVSDTLPIGEGHFDLVIFDEASQIPLEEAVPAFSRSAQVIVVGDEMQLPPTSFFSAAPLEDELEIVADEEEGDRIAILMDADSLLAQSARNLPATMLAWHYRSRSEALIGFSNAAFYGGRLITIPDRVRIEAQAATAPVRSDDPEGWAGGARRALGQAITVHRIADGVYEKRANAPEAAYIAGMVRALLAGGSGESIGIVAFSEAQQSEIEAALDRLAADDSDFAAALEREVVREEDGQYNGLFVKNLENVQGDERDIMLLSICYAPGRDGRMAMNFGPINQRGGEKRLNVIFSRARRHMAIVTTIAPEAITNTHNDGARALRAFLSFAEAQSAGAHDHAQAVLAGIGSGESDAFASEPPPDPVRAAIAAALRGRGHAVDEHVGGSSFRCDLAIVAPGGAAYALGILLDHERDAATGPRERYLFRPSILRSFGWRIVDVPVSSWRAGPQAVLDRIESELRVDSWAAADGASGEEAQEDGASISAAAPAVPDPEEAAPSAEAMTEFRLKQGSSDKFWRVGVIECDLVVEFGRTGTRGQRVVKSFDSAERAQREASKLTLEKTRKGYVEVG